MTRGTVRIALGHSGPPNAVDDITLHRGELRQLLRRGRLLRLAGRFRQATIDTDDVRFPRAPLLAPAVGRLLAPRSVRYEDRRGGIREVGWRWHVVALGAFVRDLVHAPAVRRRAVRAIRSIEAASHRPTPALRRGEVAYLRTDLVFGMEAGGSVGHVAGVVNNLGAAGYLPVVIAPDPVPTVDPGIPTEIIVPQPRFWDFRRMPRTHYNLTYIDRAEEALAGHAVAWVYHRLSLGSFAAAVLAVRHKLPFVLEYNGSEVWVEANWGVGGVDELDVRIEDAVLSLADLVVVVSSPLRDELVRRGVRPERILVNPNGVDVERYAPEVSGRAVRERLGITDASVVGFIGTFGRWHGANVLVEAFLRLRAETSHRVHLLMIGDGVLRADAERTVLKGGAQDAATFTGLIPQTDGPEYLAACDVLVAPHVPNADGSPFFGSPTKLFEYLAMGRCIVASDLDQIGEVIEDGITGVLVRPGDAQSLADGLRRVLDDEALRGELSKAARRRAVERHTWRGHTESIVIALQDLLPMDASPRR